MSIKGTDMTLMTIPNLLLFFFSLWREKELIFRFKCIQIQIKKHILRLSKTNVTNVSHLIFWGRLSFLIISYRNS